MSSHWGRGEGMAESATECHIFHFMENFFIFKHKPKVAMPLLNMLSVMKENHPEHLTSCRDNGFCFLSYTDTGAVVKDRIINIEI